MSLVMGTTTVPDYQWSELWLCGTEAKRWWLSATRAAEPKLENLPEGVRKYWVWESGRLIATNHPLYIPLIGQSGPAVCPSRIKRTVK